MLHIFNKYYFNYKHYRVFSVILLTGLWLSYAGNVMARPDGISGFSGEGSDCTICHTNSGTANVSLSADSGSTTVTPGSTSSYTLTLTGGPAAVAGLDVHLTAGTVIDTNASGTKILNGELVHSAPNNMNGSISWTFDWQAPAAEGTYMFYAAGLSGDGDGGDTNDATAVTSLQITVAGVINQAPVAAISAPATGTEGVAVTFDASNSSDPDGTIAAYDWDFGDNSAGSGVTVTHAFAAGTYTVMLTVTDDSGATASTSVSIDIAAAVNEPPVAVISGPNTGAEGVAVSFDGSGSSDNDGTITAYDWDFGDNTAGSGVSVSHSYTAGTYMVTLTVTDDAGATASDSREIVISAPNQPQPPVADAGGPYAAMVGEAVQFDGTASTDPDGSIQTYEWSFGDGNTGTGVGPVHAYTMAGTYTVTLTVTDDQGMTGSATTTAEISEPNAQPQPPVADAGGPYSGVAGTAVLFDGSASTDPDGTIQTYVWDFGDNTSGNGVGPVHTYAAAGVYTVTLTVTDDQGLTSMAETTTEIAEDVLQEEETTAEGLYDQWCAACHGAQGVGGQAGDVVGESADDIVEAIEDEKDMAFLADVLSDSDIEAIAEYLQGLDAADDDYCDADEHSGDSDDEHTDRHEDRESCDKDEDENKDDDKDSDKDKDKDKNANPFSVNEEGANAADSGGGGVLAWLILAGLIPVSFARYRAK